MFTKLATKVDSQEMWLYLLFLVEIHIPPNHFLARTSSLSQRIGVSAYFLTTDKAIVTKLDQTIKEIERYKNLKFGDKGS